MSYRIDENYGILLTTLLYCCILQYMNSFLQNMLCIHIDNILTVKKITFKTVLFIKFFMCSYREYIFLNYAYIRSKFLIRNSKFFLFFYTVGVIFSLKSFSTNWYYISIFLHYILFRK